MSPILEDYLPEDETARELGKTPRTLQNWRQQGIGPPYTVIGKTIYYERPKLLSWLRDQQRQPVRTRPYRGIARATA
jgi:hypothetical protein